MTKQELFQIISDAADYGNICLFIGAGFSKAILQLSDDDSPSWLDLLEKLFKKNKLDYKKEDYIGWSCPQIASELVKKISEINKTDIEEATKKLKNQIAEVFKYKIPKNDICLKLQELLCILNPRCIITTNYDFILEAIFPGIGYSLTKEECLDAPRKLIPIYHLHGTCQKPETIVITNEDYIQLFRPNDYRLEKLSMIMKESTVIFLGYAIGDQNVQMAIDWANNVYNSIPFEHSNLIQFKRTKSSPSDVIREENSLKILEINDLIDTLRELNDFRRGILNSLQKTDSALEKFATILTNSAGKAINDFIQSQAVRQNIISKVKKRETDLINPFKIFIYNVYRELWKRARAKNAFNVYDDMVKIMIDLLIGLSPIHPSFFISIVEEFAKFAEYVGRQFYGQSFSAYDTWKDSCDKIPDEVCIQLKQYGFNHSFYIEKLMEDRLGDK